MSHGKNDYSTHERPGLIYRTYQRNAISEYQTTSGQNPERSAWGGIDGYGEKD